MDWNLKEAAAPIWDFTEFPPPPPPQETTLLLDGLSSGSAMANRDLSVDLKLGQVSNGGVVVGPTKRARGTVNNNVVCQGQAVCCCLVDGCDADLSRSREYHRRHKVCELHSKTPEVTIGGHKQRFCQQCSRFHSLEEFDEGKRSCRKRLEGHNRRRRKPQPDPPFVNCLSNYQGGTSRASPSCCFSNTNHIYSPVIAAGGGNQHTTTWLGGGGGAGAAHYNQQMRCFHNIPTTLLSSSSSSETTIFGGSSQTLPPSRGVSGSSYHHHHNNSSNNNNMYYFLQQDTDCALSLLSSPSPQMMQHLGIHHQGTSSSSYSTSTAATTTHCTSLFGHNSPPQTLAPFHWD